MGYWETFAEKKKRHQKGQLYTFCHLNECYCVRGAERGGCIVLRRVC